MATRKSEPERVPIIQRLPADELSRRIEETRQAAIVASERMRDAQLSAGERERARKEARRLWNKYRLLLAKEEA